MLREVAKEESPCSVDGGGRRLSWSQRTAAQAASSSKEKRCMLLIEL